MTLWLPWGNYVKSYAGVAQQIALKLPSGQHCVDSNVGAAQRASFAYFGKLPFAQFSSAKCNLYLLQDSVRNKGEVTPYNLAGGQWKLLWEGRRPSDRDERFRFYQRVN